MKRFLTLAMFLGTLWPALTLAETPLRIVSPLPGQHTQTPSREVVIEGPPGADVQLSINDGVPEFVRLDESGVGRFRHAAPPLLPISYVATIVVDGEVRARAGARLTLLTSSRSPVIRRNRLEGVLGRYVLALGCGAGAAVFSLVAGNHLAPAFGRDTELHSSVAAAGLSVALSPIAVMGCLSGVQNTGSAWMSAAGAAGIGLLGLGVMFLVQDDEEDVVTMAYTVMMFAPLGAMAGAGLSVRWGPDMFGASYSVPFD